MDKRQQKSEAVIMRALFELMKQRDLDKISISEIAKLANVNRGTIYSRYVDKYDLFNHFIEYHCKKLVADCRNLNQRISEISKATLTEIFEHLEAQRDVFQVIFSDIGLPIFTTKMKKELIEKLTCSQTAVEVKKDLRAVFIASAIVGVFEWWFKEHEITSSELADELWSLLNQLAV